MSIFGFFQDLFKPKAVKTTFDAVEDVLFGKLERVSPRILSGKIRFAPLNQEIEIVIENGQSPDEEQREFYRELERRYDEFSGEIGDALHREFLNFVPDSSRRRIWDKLKLESVSILKNGETDWEISYFCPSLNRYFDVGMNGWKVEQITTDNV